MNKKSQVPDKRQWMFYAACAVGLLVILCAVFPEKIRVAYEVSSTKIFPNAQKEFAFGERHFDAKNPEVYDVRLAEYFFRSAEKHDASILYLYHELARVDFLKGNYVLALNEINKQIETQGDKTPNSYYVRGLIEGYMAHYASSEMDYRTYLTFDPTNWAATNDLAWVLLKDHKPKEALEAIDKVLPQWQENPWLLNSKATALFDMGRKKDAYAAIIAASSSVDKLSASEWSRAYPGNDPLIGEEGVDKFKKAISDNMHRIAESLKDGK